MKKIVNEDNKEVWEDVTADDLFSEDLFHDVDMRGVDTDTQKAFHSNLGSITVLDRLTGFGFNVRDVETGYRDNDGEFWLASGGCDVLLSGVDTIGEAVEWIKSNEST